jgi:DNA polymerase (family 10)
MTNLETAELLRRVAAAYQILGENRFKIIAYERAATSIEHLTSELKDYWDDKKLDEVPGVGAAIAGHLDELFRTGHVKHFDQVLGKLPSAIYPLLLVPGIGPKKAYKLVKELHLKSEKTVVADIEKAVKAGKIAPIEGFGQKSQEVILTNVQTYKKGQIKENRMALPIADGIAQHIMAHLTKIAAVKRVDALGSLRRQVSTIGDIDLAVATIKPKEVIAHFLTYPHQEIIEQGPTGASLRLHNGRQVDLRVQKPDLYGAMLQYFTGGKNHNIALRSWALKKGLSLNEYGIKHVKSGKIEAYATEESFYRALGLSYIPPELREDKGEIAAALRQAQGKPDGLPHLVELSDIKGDLHIHTDYNLEPSHDLGANSFGEMLKKAESLSYEYIGISDHNPSIGNHSEKQIVEIMKRRKSDYEHKYSSRIHYLLMCEVDILPDGKLALPEKAFEYVDGIIVSVHSAFTQDTKTVTKRIITALESHPKVRILGHPTGRLLTKREGVNADWAQVFDVCKKYDIALEINAYPDRLDLPDTLVFDAVKKGLKFTIDTDAHAVEHMDLMKYGVSVARRGWATKHDILNTLGYNEFKKWFLPT